MKKLKHNTYGQIIAEVAWLVIFLSVFLATMAHLYDEGNKEIEKSRIGGKYKIRIQTPKISNQGKGFLK